MIKRFFDWYDDLSWSQSFLVRISITFVFILWHIPWVISVQNGGSTTTFHYLIDIALLGAVIFLIIRYWALQKERGEND